MKPTPSWAEGRSLPLQPWPLSGIQIHKQEDPFLTKNGRRRCFLTSTHQLSNKTPEMYNAKVQISSMPHLKWGSEKKSPISQLSALTIRLFGIQGWASPVVAVLFCTHHEILIGKIVVSPMSHASAMTTELLFSLCLIQGLFNYGCYLEQLQQEILRESVTNIYAVQLLRRLFLEMGNKFLGIFQNQKEEGFKAGALPSTLSALKASYRAKEEFTTFSIFFPFSIFVRLDVLRVLLTI